MNTRKFHLSISLSQEAISFVNSLGKKNFSVGVEEIIQSYQKLEPNHARTEAVRALRASAQKLKTDGCPQEAILSWARDALRVVK